MQAKAGTQAQRQALRREHTLPALQPLHERLTQSCQTAAPGYGLAKACDFLLRRWPAFVRSANTGDLPIDNNPVVNAIRPIAVGKKNWLLAGSEGAGQRAAAIQSLLATAKLNGLEPAAWLTQINLGKALNLPEQPDRRATAHQTLSKLDPL